LNALAVLFSTAPSAFGRSSSLFQSPYGAGLAPLLLALLGDVAAQGAAAAAETAALATGAVPAEVLLWDARYLVASLAAPQLKQAGLDYGAWFVGVLAPCLTALMAGGPGAGRQAPPVLRRRLLLLMGTWMSEVRGEIKPALYGALVGLLGASAGEDPAVCLCLLSTLREVKPPLFPYFIPFFVFCFPLLRCVFI
jgi:hypothetical protein